MFGLAPSALEAFIPIAGGLLGLWWSFRTGSPLGNRARRILRWTSPVLVGFGVLLLLSPRGGGGSADAATVASGIKAKLALPVQVDDATRLDDVRAISRSELGYFLTLTGAGAAVDAAQLESHLRAGACQNPDYLAFFRAGISLSFTYQTPDQVQVARVSMVPKDCGL